MWPIIPLIASSPLAVKVIGGTLLAAGGMVVAPAVAVGALGAVGFGAAGPVAGSIAAGVQASVYGGAVGVGSLFVVAQSAAMGGIAVAGPAVVGAGTAVMGSGAAVLALLL